MIKREKYSDFFIRIQDHQHFDENPYSKPIHSPFASEKEKVLFADCFSHHLKNIPSQSNFLYVEDESSNMFIQKDNLTAFFINHIYKPPELKDYDTNTYEKYETFKEDFISSSIFLDSTSKFEIGKNKIRYLLGNVGEGKTAFVRKLYNDIIRESKIIDEYNIVPIYLDLEEIFNFGSEIPEPLKDSFEIKLYYKIIEKLNEQATEQTKKFLGNFDHLKYKEDPQQCIKLLVSEMKSHKMRLILCIDNLDFYHYYYSRYSFFEEGYKQQEEIIDKNIQWLISLISSEQKLGHLGLNVLISMRKHVFNIVNNHRGTVTEIGRVKAFELSPVSEEDIISSRIKLLSHAIEAITKKYPIYAGTLGEKLYYIKLKLIGEESTIKQKDGSKRPLSKIYELCQHGHRSLVHFLFSMNLASFDKDLVTRFFEKQVSTLYILYINKMYKRYSQKKNHFPNIFLNDCLVMSERRFPSAHQKHVHTYWLKFLLLKYIYKNEACGVKLCDLLNDFYGKNKYEEHLVRHVIGSLSTPNEFSCIFSDRVYKERPFEGQKLYLTNRGKTIMKKENEIEFCFGFEYLGTIIDDCWNLFPIDWIDNLYDAKSDYNHVYMKGTEYIESSLMSVTKKAKMLLYFVRILEASFNIEFSEKGIRSGLITTISKYELKPAFNIIRKQILESAMNLCRSFNSIEANKISDLEKLDKNLQKDSSYEKFFKEYYESGIEITA